MREAFELLIPSNGKIANQVLAITADAFLHMFYRTVWKTRNETTRISIREKEEFPLRIFLRLKRKRKKASKLRPTARSDGLKKSLKCRINMEDKWSNTFPVTRVLPVTLRYPRVGDSHA